MRNLNDEAANWATPSANQFEAKDLDRMLQRQAQQAEKNGNNGFGLTLANEVQVWARERWPTPAARDHKGTNSTEHVETNGSGRMHMDQLPNFVEHGSHLARPDPTTSDGLPSSVPRRNLNPLFVEWLMRWPIGWTDFGCSETGSILWRQRMRGYVLTLLTARIASDRQGSMF